jgi:hypothetical protein
VVAADVHEQIDGLLPGAARHTIDVSGRHTPIPVLVASL